MNCILVHGSNVRDREKISEGVPFQNKRHWFPWVQSELERRNILCSVPLMPESWAPDYMQWKKEFEKLNVDMDSILVGHSTGGAFLVRWLSETGKKIRKLILVAPAIWYFEDDPFLKRFFDFEINPEIRENVNELIIFFSDNDSQAILKSVNVYSNALGGKVVQLRGRGHFIERHMGGQEFPELLAEILRQ